MTKNKLKVMHYYTDPFASGGPLTYINTLNNSELKNEIDFKTCFQMKTLKEMRFYDFQRIIHEIKRFNPDILHIHGIQSEGFVGALCGRFAHCNRILMTVHGMQNDSVLGGKLKRFIYRYLIENKAVRMCDAIYCVCKYTQNLPIIQKNAKHIYPVVVNCAKKMGSYDRADVRNKLGYKEEDFVCIYVGRITKMKGCDILARCIKKSRINNLRYLIVGDGEYLNEMRQFLKEEEKKGIVQFVGKREDVGYFLSCSDMFISLSLKENLSISILEAGLYKLPCLVTNVGGNPEIIDNMVDGILVDPSNSNTVLEAIQFCTNHKSEIKQMGVHLSEKVNTVFSESALINKVREIYFDII